MTAPTGRAADVASGSRPGESPRLEGLAVDGVITNDPRLFEAR